MSSSSVFSNPPIFLSRSMCHPSLSAVFLGPLSPKNPSPDLWLPSSCPSLGSLPPHPEPLLPSAQPGDFLQLSSPASPHHPDCPLPAPALISPGPLALRSQLPGPRPCCLSHTMSPAWAWGTSGAPLPPRPLPHGVWEDKPLCDLTAQPL